MASNIKLKNNLGNTFTLEHSNDTGDVNLTSTQLKNIRQVDTIADLRAMTDTQNTVWVSGYHTKDDGAFGSNIFRWNPTSTEDDNNGTIIKLDSVETGRYELQYSGAVNVKWFGAKGDGVTDDTNSIQSAIDFTNNVFISEGEYAISRNNNGAINYGLKIEKSDIIVSGIRGKSILKRYDSDIATYANAYPIIHIGTVDILDSSKISEVSICDLDLVGNDTRHNISGSYLNDLRTLIQVKGTMNLKISGIKFLSIDSSAIYFDTPEKYSYIDSTLYNIESYSEFVIVDSCIFYGLPHTTTGRALLHAIVASGVNGLRITNNSFSWCDDAVSGQSTYDVDDLYGERYTSTYNRDGIDYYCCGKDWVISNNNILNSSEHSFYITGANVSINSNTIETSSDYCVGDVKVRGQNITVSNNSILSQKRAITISELSRNIVINGNTIDNRNEDTAGCINISVNNIKSFVDNRPWFDTSVEYPKCKNILISNNTINTKDVPYIYGYAIRILTDSSSVSGYDDGTLENVKIEGNIITNFRVGLMSYATFYNVESISFSSNIVKGGSFTKTSFDGSDLKGYSVLALRNNYYYNLQKVSCNNNIFEGFKYIFGILGDDGQEATGSLAHRPTKQFTSNVLTYFMDLSAGVSSTEWYHIDGSLSIFSNNKGEYFVTRNTMADLSSFGNTINYGGSSYKRGATLWDGTNLRYYYDDLGNYKVLGNA